MKDNNCFIILCWFLPYIKHESAIVYICPLLLKPLLTSLPIPPHQVVTDPALVWVPWVRQQIPISYLFYIDSHREDTHFSCKVWSLECVFLFFFIFSYSLYSYHSSNTSVSLDLCYDTLHISLGNPYSSGPPPYPPSSSAKVPWVGRFMSWIALGTKPDPQVSIGLFIRVLRSVIWNWFWVQTGL